MSNAYTQHVLNKVIDSGIYMLDGSFRNQETNLKITRWNDSPSFNEAFPNGVVAKTSSYMCHALTTALGADVISTLEEELARGEIEKYVTELQIASSTTYNTLFLLVGQLLGSDNTPTIVVVINHIFRNWADRPMTAEAVQKLADFLTAEYPSDDE